MRIALFAVSLTEFDAYLSKVEDMYLHNNLVKVISKARFIGSKIPYILIQKGKKSLSH